MASRTICKHDCLDKGVVEPKNKGVDTSYLTPGVLFKDFVKQHLAGRLEWAGVQQLRPVLHRVRSNIGVAIVQNDLRPQRSKACGPPTTRLRVWDGNHEEEAS